MEGCCRGLGAVVMALVCAAGLLSGCGREQPVPADPSTSPSRDPACVRTERRRAESIWLWKAAHEVSNAGTGYSDQARNTVVEHTWRAERRLREACGGSVPEGFADFSDAIAPVLAASRFGTAELEHVLLAWSEWGEAVGRPGAARDVIDGLAFCREEIFPRLDVSYRVRSERTDAGKVWWIDLTFENRTGEVLVGSMGGTVRVTNMLEDRFGKGSPDAGPGKDATLTWGGSSFDQLVLRPGTTRTGVAPDADRDVHTEADGTFDVTAFDLGLSPPDGRHACYPPVRSIP